MNQTGKATGIVGIPSECYKYASAELLQPVTALFNYVFESGIYPDKWCEGIINPIHNQGSRLVAENYRKITVSPSIGKLFDTIINNRLIYYRCISNEEDPFQNGFKEKSRTIDNAFILNGIIEKYKALGQPLYICYVDFNSAFDYINRNALLFKLLKRGVTGKNASYSKKHVFQSQKLRQVEWQPQRSLWEFVCRTPRGSHKLLTVQHISWRSD